MIADMVSQICSLQIIHDDIHLTAVLEGRVQVDDEGTPHLFEEVELVED